MPADIVVGYSGGGLSVGYDVSRICGHVDGWAVGA